MNELQSQEQHGSRSPLTLSLLVKYVLNPNTGTRLHPRWLTSQNATSMPQQRGLMNPFFMQKWSILTLHLWSCSAGITPVLRPNTAGTLAPSLHWRPQPSSSHKHTLRGQGLFPAGPATILTPPAREGWAKGEVSTGAPQTGNASFVK